MLNTNLAHHSVLYECSAQCPQGPTGACEAKLARFHLGMTNNIRTDVWGEDKRVRRAPGCLETEYPMALEALKPATYTTPPDT